MIPLNNYISKALFSENLKQSGSGPQSILTYIDIDKIYTKKQLIKLILKLYKKNPILNQIIVNHNDKLYLETDLSLNITDYYSIKYLPEEMFNDEIYTLLNKSLNNPKKWYLFYCIDKKTKKSRLYFKIFHAYADGYQLIKILTSILGNETENITKKFKRNTSNLYDKIYYLIIGTIILILILILILI